MPEEKFRPQRKPISQEDLGSVPNPADLLKARLSEEAEFSETDAPPESFQKAQNFSEGQAEGLKISGNIPPAFQAMLNKGAPAPQPKRFANQPMHVKNGSDKLNSLMAGINSSIVYHEVELPSKGKFYNGQDGPTNGIIHIRPMTGAEEEVLATPNLVKKGKAMNEIFNRCIQEQYNSENLLSMDRTYLFIYLRGISYSVYYDVEIKCPECDAKFLESIDLDTLEVTPCPENYDTDNLKDKLPRSGYQFSYRLPTGFDEARVQEHRQFRLKNFETGETTDDTILYRTALLLNDIEGLTDKTELLILLKQLPIEDTNYLRNVVTDPPFGVNTKIPILCKSCIAPFDLELPLEANFFFPKNKKEVLTHV